MTKTRFIVLLGTSGGAMTKKRNLLPLRNTGISLLGNSKSSMTPTRAVKIRVKKYESRRFRRWDVMFIHHSWFPQRPMSAQHEPEFTR
jgi:hypothetical protein